MFQVVLLKKDKVWGGDGVDKATRTWEREGTRSIEEIGTSPNLLLPENSHWYPLHARDRTAGGSFRVWGSRGVSSGAGPLTSLFLCFPAQRSRCSFSSAGSAPPTTMVRMLSSGLFLMTIPASLFRRWEVFVACRSKNWCGIGSEDGFR